MNASLSDFQCIINGLKETHSTLQFISNYKSRSLSIKQPQISHRGKKAVNLLKKATPTLDSNEAEAVANPTRPDGPSNFGIFNASDSLSTELVPNTSTAGASDLADNHNPNFINDNVGSSSNAEDKLIFEFTEDNELKIKRNDYLSTGIYSRYCKSFYPSHLKTLF
ncbi:hypothetical protein BDF20DRAFT_866233 [Mycotypha africana]|uniref:uncharacterized protein n=1 Tax=Mycotypha africana TaxID=64632 RepID=UPI00230094F0|nr:uncharacterized protein BDF20DRAFT_866233 [Mycotypha africana]KAI8982319.1 hypothetical protein BDF20DRAFT_866233 [Mycotypha africana]